MDGIARGGSGWAWPLGPDRVVVDAFEAYGPEIHRHLRSLVRNDADAEDLGQETFLRLHTEVRGGRAPQDPRAWLHRVAANLAMSRGRHLQVEARTAPRLREREEGSGAEDQVIRRDEHRHLSAALATLSETDREVLLLAAAGYGSAEIAERLGRTPLATRTLLCRARARLRLRLQEQVRTSP
jgi:RNA polymerase sigma-70 factor (ECF subfamily)